MTFECWDGTPETGSHWKHLGKGKPEVWIDFHHTITMKCGACPDGDLKALCAGEPQKGVKEAFQKIKEMGFSITIYSAYGTHIGNTFEAFRQIQKWLRKHGLDLLVDSIRTDKPGWAYFIDDRGIHHKGWKNTLNELSERSGIDIQR